MEKKSVARHAFSPGEYIRDELEARGWTQLDLATIMGRPLRTVNEIIAAKKTITPETAVGLARAFGTSAELWINLEGSYRVAMVEDDNEDVAHKARIFGIAPVNEMTKREWIKPHQTVKDLERHILAFFEIATLDEKPKLSPAARKATPYDSVTPAQFAWFYRAKHLAAGMRVKKYSKDNFVGLVKTLQSLAGHVEELRHIPKVLGDAGIRFVVIEHLTGSRIDGGAFWLGKNEPVIVLSIRYDRVDGFWHTLGHELGHIHNEDDGVIDIDLINENAEIASQKPECEIKADEYAEQLTIQRSELEDFIVRTKPLYAKKKIEGFAARIGVHPGIVVGQLQHRKEISYSHSREMLVKVRDIVTSTALTDGWGHKLSL